MSHDTFASEQLLSLPHSQCTHCIRGLSKHRHLTISSPASKEDKQVTLGAPDWAVTMWNLASGELMHFQATKQCAPTLSTVREIKEKRQVQVKFRAELF